MKTPLLLRSSRNYPPLMTSALPHGAEVLENNVGLASDSVAKLDYLRILMTAYSNSGRFLSRFRLMPWRDFVIRLVVSIFLMAFRLF
jgi:hypothetical protein